MADFDTNPQLLARDRTLGHLAMLCFSALVAGSFSLGGLAANEISPVALNGVRFILAAVALGLMAHFTGGIPRKALQAPWRFLILGGMFSLYFVTMFEGLKTATPVSTAAVFTLTPILAAGFGYVLMRQITTARIAFALCVGAAGALWVIFRADFGAFLAFDVGRGEMIYFIGVISHGLYTPLVARFSRGESAFVFIFFVLVAASLVLGTLGAGEIMAADWANMPPIVWITLLYTAIAATAISSTLLVFASVRLAASKVMAYTYLTPSWVLVWELALGHGVPNVMMFGGIALTVVALMLLLKHEN